MQIIQIEWRYKQNISWDFRRWLWWMTPQAKAWCPSRDLHHTWSRLRRSGKFNVNGFVLRLHFSWFSIQVLPSITNEVLKQVVAEFDAGELITMREQVPFANISQGAKIISNFSWGTWSIIIISFQGERPDESRACDSRRPVRSHPRWHQHHPPYLWKVPVFVQNRDWFFNFVREFTAAVEQKQVAQQEAEKARFLVERAEFYKKAAVIQV